MLIWKRTTTMDVVWLDKRNNIRNDTWVRKRYLFGICIHTMRSTTTHDITQDKAKAGFTE